MNQAETQPHEENCGFQAEGLADNKGNSGRCIKPVASKTLQALQVGQSVHPQLGGPDWKQLFV